MSGPTGTIGPKGAMGLTGMTGPTGPTYLLTLADLQKSKAGLVEQESTDLATLGPLIIPNMGIMNPTFQTWASVGYPPLYVLLSMKLLHPSPCSDEYICQKLLKSAGFVRLILTIELYN